MPNENLTESLKSEALRLGFDYAGACPAIEPHTIGHLESWLDAGYFGEMSYLDERREAYRDPNMVMDGAASVLMLATNYQTVEPVSPQAGQGRVSRYAWSDCDYHDKIHARLKSLVKFCESWPTSIRARGIVDTAPLLEREFAQLAGLGWQAKNTMLISREIGSWFFIAALLVDVKLDYDQRFETSHCGTCTACLDACPTDAFVSPHVLDATKCISYLTIEHRSPIPLELRPQMQDWIFGCDVCQDVCPWNRKTEATDDADFQPNVDRNPMALRELFYLDDDQFRQRFRKTPLWRPKRRGILRNSAIVLGNRPDQENVAALSAGLNDAEELVRGACAWALGNHLALGTQEVLRDRLAIESCEEVRNEIQWALGINAEGG